jgi:hypothetical protein
MRDGNHNSPTRSDPMSDTDTSTNELILDPQAIDPDFEVEAEIDDPEEN